MKYICNFFKIFKLNMYICVLYNYVVYGKDLIGRLINLFE